MIWNKGGKNQVIIDYLGGNSYAAVYRNGQDEELTFLFTLNLDSIVRLYYFLDLIKTNYSLNQLDIIYQQEKLQECWLPF